MRTKEEESSLPDFFHHFPKRCCVKGLQDNLVSPRGDEVFDVTGQSWVVNEKGREEREEKRRQGGDGGEEEGGDEKRRR